MYAVLIAYEQEGKDGEFDVITTMGVVRCKEDELKKFIAATPGAAVKCWSKGMLWNSSRQRRASASRYSGNAGWWRDEPTRFA